jgi:hypothetical protein
LLFNSLNFGISTTLKTTTTSAASAANLVCSVDVAPPPGALKVVFLVHQQLDYGQVPFLARKVERPRPEHGLRLLLGPFGQEHRHGAELPVVGPAVDRPPPILLNKFRKKKGQARNKNATK